LVRQKIILNIEKELKQFNFSGSDEIFVLYLPSNEIHELGLMFLNYLLVKEGFHSVYLGQSVPMDSLVDIQKSYDKVTYITYFTIQPETDKVEDYFNDFKKDLLVSENFRLIVLGRKMMEVKLKKIPEGINVFQSIDEVREHLLHNKLISSKV
ncbi:MAG: MerR family transcriptional regulator, partial [Flavobacteriaceae bacterium]|nr:MerR family transcriptional regulator [Flavobacteriaceae bacterium]